MGAHHSCDRGRPSSRVVTQWPVSHHSQRRTVVGGSRGSDPGVQQAHEVGGGTPVRHVGCGGDPERHRFAAPSRRYDCCRIHRHAAGAPAHRSHGTVGVGEGCTHGDRSDAVHPPRLSRRSPRGCGARIPAGGPERTGPRQRRRIASGFHRLAAGCPTTSTGARR